MNENGYCKLHDPRALLCGHATKSGSPCKLIASECPHHGEHRIPMGDRTKPSIFRVENLRFDKWDAVKEYRDGLDVYSNNMKVGEVTNQDQQVDHVTELHVIRDNFDLIQKQGTGFQKKKQDLANLLRSNIVNEVENLNTTAERSISINVKRSKNSKLCTSTIAGRILIRVLLSSSLKICHAAAHSAVL